MLHWRRRRQHPARPGLRHHHDDHSVAHHHHTDHDGADHDHHDGSAEQLRSARPPGRLASAPDRDGRRPGGAQALRQSVPVGFRYQYLAGGANTGGGWSTWNTNGDFARFYIEDSPTA